ncbi:iron chelate uptake ABC transporter family permease subunit [Abyssicoccus albus]|uniref:Iron complex transport system permease protein n=1 Tax=Abyssicoccus albus TaxID=1817405 RepID=A0A3N5CEF2_9BACL|nr:iron chelate uptake ABC transporter family permease subunit [Abyssicoccus albus]RPF57455.1 iron complex transport system permease protein [Abyssicoccus albus]
MAKHKRSLMIKLGILTLITLLSITFYVFWDINFKILHYQLPSRLTRIWAMILMAIAIGVSTTLFQTISRNRILTPSIMGLDAAYLFIQTLLVFIFGATSQAMMNTHLNFFIAMISLVTFTMFLFGYMFNKTAQSIFKLLLIGVILGTLFQSLASFVQILINPDDFLILQNTMFASFNAIQSELLIISTVIIALLVIVIYIYYLPYLDVMGLGRDHAINLGVEYDKIVKQLLFIVAILVSVSTALVGPITFLGLLIVNLAHEFIKSHKHSHILYTTILFGILSLIGAQSIVQYIMQQETEISVLINFIGGIYFIFLIIKESRS